MEKAWITACVVLLCTAVLCVSVFAQTEKSDNYAAQDLLVKSQYVKEFMAKGKTGGGYVDYLFSKKEETTAQPKRSYVLLFKPFGWIVGSGYRA